MKAFVNDACIGCGLCADICPQIFKMGDGVAQAEDIEIEASLADSAMDAKTGCPVGAIELE